LSSKGFPYEVGGGGQKKDGGEVRVREWEEKDEIESVGDSRNNGKRTRE
jgi:hypothetical protein